MARAIVQGTLLVLMLAPAWAQKREMVRDLIRGDTMFTLGPPGMIPAIHAPRFVGVADARALYADDEPVLVVRSGELARAYSTWHLDRHEVVNDRVDGLPIAVTW